MKKNEELHKTQSEDRKHSPLYDGVRKMVLAGIGAMALAQDEIEDFIDRLVERGEIAEKEGKELAQEIRERRKKERTKARERVNERVEEVLDQMNVPTKKDIQALNDKLTALSKKVEVLNQGQTEE